MYFVKILIISLAMLVVTPSFAQRKKKTTEQQPVSTPRTYVVDDEACGCELFFIDGIQTTQRDGLFGFKLEDGTEIVEPRYKFVDHFHGDYCLVLRDYNQVGLIDRTGKEIVPAEYEEVNYPSDDLIRVRKDGLYGFMDMYGEWVIQPQYRASSTFSEGLAVVAVDLDSFTVMYGYIDTKGKTAIPPMYDYANPFHNGYAVVAKYERQGMIDLHGKEVFPIKYDYVSSVDDNGNFFVTDPNAILDDDSDEEGEAHNHAHHHHQLGRYAMFSTVNFKPLTPYIYDEFPWYSEGLYVYRQDSTYGFLDAKGKKRLKSYGFIQGFANGFCLVGDGRHYGIINRKGKIVLPIEYDNSGYRSDAYFFFEGLALVEKQGRYGYIDTEGRIVIPIIYSSGYRFSEGLAPVQKGSVWGFIDHQGRESMPFVFDSASPFEYGRSEVVYQNIVFKINPQGRCVKNCSRVSLDWVR